MKIIDLLFCKKKMYSLGSKRLHSHFTAHQPVLPDRLLNLLDLHLFVSEMRMTTYSAHDLLKEVYQVLSTQPVSRNY